MATTSAISLFDSPTLTQYQSSALQQRSLKDLERLVQSINQYSLKYTNHRQGKLSMLDLASERFSELEAINSILDKLNSFACFSEEERLTFMEESLKMIKMIYALAERKPSKESIKEKSGAEIMKVIAQKEMNAFQKLADFTMDNLVTPATSLKTLQQILEVILQIFFQIKTESNQGLRQKEKAKKKQAKPTIISMYYCLQSGQKVNLAWLLIFRMLQKIHFQERCCQEDLLFFVENEVNKSIHLILNFIMRMTDSHTLVKSLLVCLVDNIKEMELPIVPLFLKAFLDTLISQFKSEYKFHGSLPSHLLLGKSIFSIQHMNILCSLAKTIQTSMSQFQMGKESLICKACSYCGLNQQQSTDYLIVKTNYSCTQRLAISICLNCCRQLGIQPDGSYQSIVLAPLIMSRFWNWNQSKGLQQTKNCLRLLFLYHSAPLNAKKQTNKNKMRSPIEIAESVAMNNTDEVVGMKFLEGVYLNFLYNHNRISLKAIQYEILNLLLICMNAKDQKIRQKACKICDQPHLIQFIFKEIQQTEEGNHFKQKFEMIALVKLRDGETNIKVAALSLLSNIYSRNQVSSHLKLDFYRSIYKDITFSNSAQYIAKSITIIDNSIFKFIRTQGQQDLLGTVQIAVQTYYFCIDCMDKLKPSTDSDLRAQIAKLVSKILQEIYEIGKLQQQDFDEEHSLTNAFNDNIKIEAITSKNMRDVYDTLILKSLEWNRMDEDIIRSFPVLTPALILATIEPKRLQPTEIDRLPIIQNLLNIVNLAFQDILQAKRQVYRQSQTKTSKSKTIFDINQLRTYFFSQAFFQKLLAKHRFDKISQALLNKLLSVYNFCLLVSDRKKLSGPLKAVAKSKGKLANLMRFMTGEIENLLIQLNNSLLVDIKTCHWTCIPLKADLIMQIMFLFQQKAQASNIILNYKQCADSFLDEIKNNALPLQTSQSKEEIFSAFVSQYVLTLRLAQTFTSLVSSFELLANFDAFLQKAQNKSLPNSPSPCQQSRQFELCHEFIIDLLSTNFPEAKSHPKLQSYYKQFILLLNSYWKIYPETILRCGKILRELIASIDSRAFVKDIYRLFLSLLPCTDIRVLQLINHNLSASFHRVFEYRGLRQDPQMLQYCFRLLQHILKSGMSSLLDYNKYLFCGLLHQSPIVSTISLEVVRQIYCNEASQKMLFVSLSDTLRFIYQFYFQDTQRLPELSEQQKKGLRIIAGITRSQSKCLLVREKRALRIKASFLKKLSQILGAKRTLLQQNPLYLAFLMALIKCQDCLDYSQLYEILFTVNKYAGDNYTFIVQLRDQLESEDRQQLPQNALTIIAAYREVVSCLTYLSAYQPVSKQLNNYNRLFDSCSVPYALLQEQNPLSTAEPNQSGADCFLRLNEDIDLHMSISVGNIECVPTRSKKIAQTTHEEEEDSSTNQTKPKGMKTRGRQKSTKKGSRVQSARKQRSAKKCGRQEEEWSGNTSSINESPF